MKCKIHVCFIFETLEKQTEIDRMENDGGKMVK